MALPTDDHVTLRTWLAHRGVEADEVTGRLIVNASNALLAAAGAPMHLDARQLGVLARARAASRQLTQIRPNVSKPAPDTDEDTVMVVLEEVAGALGRVRVTAVPYTGIGVIFGGEALLGKVLIEDATGLYERMTRVTLSD